VLQIHQKCVCCCGCIPDSSGELRALHPDLRGTAMAKESDRKRAEKGERGEKTPLK